MTSELRYFEGNESRRIRAKAALAAYQSCDGVESMAAGATFNQVLCDLLTDLRHEAHAHDVECFNDADIMASNHFDVELREASEINEEDA